VAAVATQPSGPEERNTVTPAATVNATARLVEVQVDDWPYVFAVATRDLHAGEELTLDFGEEYWANQCFALQKLKEMGQVSRQLIMGVCDAEGDFSKGG